MKQKRENVRNIAIIAHVDHGKTTLVDELLKQSGVFREHQEVAERVMDSNDIERERGITILSKNTAVTYKDTKINIIDTPGHADFGGEVERVLKMVNGVILVVDAFEGAMPQTKFVLRKALELKLPVIVCVNKIDRPEARPEEVIDEVLELFLDLDADEAQLDCPFVFASAKAGTATLDLNEPGKNMLPLFETILDYIPAPEGDPDAGTQILISTIDYNEYVGRIGVGKVDNGSVKVNQEVVIVNHHEPDKQKKVKISKLYEFDGLNKVDVTEAGIGSIVAISGITDIHIGDTLCATDNPTPIPFQKISEPTIAMHFVVNDSPLAGQDGKYVTSRHLRERLFRELNTDVSLRVEETDTTEAFKVSGRGELHLSVLIENMRREGYEFAVSKAEVLYKADENGKAVSMGCSYAAPAEYDVSMGMFVMKRDLLIRHVQELVPHGLYHLERDFIMNLFNRHELSVNVYRFGGVALSNDSVEAYYKNSMALLDADVRKSLFRGEVPIYTKVRDEVPTLYGKNCQIANCVVADGCRLHGKAENCVIFREVKVREGAEVADSIIMQGSVIESGASVKYAILDKNVTVKSGTKLHGSPEQPVIIRKGVTV